MKAHIESLPLATLETLRRLGRLAAARGFTLAGGTGLALHIGHRVSQVLDFFTDRPFSTTEVFEEIKALGLRARVIQEEKGTLSMLVNETKVSFLGYGYGFPEKTTLVEGVAVAGVIDIASMKVIAISQRGAKRDFVDLYFIMQDTPFWKVAENLVERYGADRINPVHIGKALVFFDDAEADPDPLYMTKARTDWKRIKRFFKDQCRQMVIDMHKAVEAGRAP
ncbi:MAG: nucleotidyl transferase AbiEii/AbiGii toxin family protein [Deltaproteobacteria bacterium]|nr:nucleotidyl transferase AbiEii/AbiGii toxin family protein [Deltaproteobacteria bacterium]